MQKHYLLKRAYRLLNLALESSIQDAEIYICNAMNIIQFIIKKKSENKKRKNPKSFFETFAEATSDS